MTHLTKTTQKNLFETTVAPRTKSVPGEAGNAPMLTVPDKPDRFAVGVDMTPEQSRETMRASWPQYEWPSVVNQTTRHRGKHY